MTLPGTHSKNESINTKICIQQQRKYKLLKLTFFLGFCPGAAVEGGGLTADVASGLAVGGGIRGMPGCGDVCCVDTFSPVRQMPILRVIYEKPLYDYSHGERHTTISLTTLPSFVEVEQSPSASYFFSEKLVPNMGFPFLNSNQPGGITVQQWTKRNVNWL